MVLERRHFLQMRRAAITIQVSNGPQRPGAGAATVMHVWPHGDERLLCPQSCWRSYRVRRALERTQAAMYLQATWRGYRHRVAYQRQRQGIIRLQSLCRGYLQRKR